MTMKTRPITRSTILFLAVLALMTAVAMPGEAGNRASKSARSTRAKTAKKEVSKTADANAGEYETRVVTGSNLPQKVKRGSMTPVTFGPVTVLDRRTVDMSGCTDVGGLIRQRVPGVR